LPSALAPVDPAPLCVDRQQGSFDSLYSTQVMPVQVPAMSASVPRVKSPRDTRVASYRGFQQILNSA